MKYAAALLLIISSSAAAQTDARPRFSPEAFRAHVTFLADDALEGRDTGTRGHDIAARYVVAQFEAAGLSPGGTDGGWLQQVPLREARLAEGSGFLTFGGKRHANGDGVFIGPSILEQDQNRTAGVVFAGHCLIEPSLKIDDFRGLDVRGKFVACLTGFPKGLPSETAAYLTEQRVRFAARKGAIGMISLTTADDEKRYPFARIVQTIGNPRMERLNPDGSVFQFAPGIVAGGALDRPSSIALFAGAPRSFEAVEAAGAERSVRGFPLKGTITVERKTNWKAITSPNVIGVVKGTDPALAAEYVVLGAHLDHIGIGTAVNGDSIYNGALDNAAGSATLIEVAKATAADRPKRSVMFIAATAEEKGLLGAEYFAGNPTVPIGSIVSMIDLDMPIITYDFQDVVAYGADHSTVAQFVGAAAGDMGVKLSPDPIPEETVFVRSDHYAFVQKGVPAIMLATGFGGPGKAAWEAFLSTNYHQPSDDMKLPIRWNQGARFAELNWRIMERIANAGTPPRWYEGDYFADKFAPRAERATPAK